MYRFSEQPWQRGRGAALPIPFLQVGKLRPEEGKPFVQGHTLSDSRVRSRTQVFCDGSLYLSTSQVQV